MRVSVNIVFLIGVVAIIRAAWIGADYTVAAFAALAWGGICGLVGAGIE